MAYAEGTDVPPERSRAEIEKILKRYGATHFAFLSSPTQGTIAFQVKRYQVRFSLQFPPLESFKITASGRTRTGSQREAARNQEERRRWRALALCVKAKLEAVGSGITTFEQEFMAHIVLPGSGETVGEALLPKVLHAIETTNPSHALEWKP